MGHMQKSSSNDQNLKARPHGRKCRSRKAVRFVLRNCRSYQIALVDDESLQVSKMMNFCPLLSALVRLRSAYTNQTTDIQWESKGPGQKGPG